jgi:hypothetical protein
MVKLIVIAFVLFLLSCHTDVPDLPGKVQFCSYTKLDGTPDCIKTYIVTPPEAGCEDCTERVSIISEEECKFIGGQYVDSCE